MRRAALAARRVTTMVGRAWKQARRIVTNIQHRQRADNAWGWCEGENLPFLGGSILWIIPFFASHHIRTTTLMDITSDQTAKQLASYERSPLAERYILWRKLNGTSYMRCGKGKWHKWTFKLRPYVDLCDWGPDAYYDARVAHDTARRLRYRIPEWWSWLLVAGSFLGGITANLLARIMVS